MESIETDRLLLRPFTMADLDGLQSVIGNDPDMTWNNAARPIEITEETLKGRIRHYEQHDFGVLGVILKATGEMIGQAGLQVVENSTEIEIVAYTAKRYWKHGVGFESCVGVLTYGFFDLDLPLIVASTRLHNFRAQKLLEKLGFRYLRQSTAYGYDVHYYDLLREAFAARNSIHIVHRDMGKISNV